MATNLKNLSQIEGTPVPSAKNMKFAIVYAEWNSEITTALREGAFSSLLQYGAEPKNITLHAVPGSFELCLGAQYVVEHGDADAIICLGCVIQGETRHFDFICNAVGQGIMQLNLKYNKPFIFGLLTTENQEQALARAGGKHGNKGDEAAITAIKMLHLKGLLTA